jgi:hypothetical protein
MRFNSDTGRNAGKKSKRPKQTDALKKSLISILEKELQTLPDALAEIQRKDLSRYLQTLEKLLVSVLPKPEFDTSDADADADASKPMWPTKFEFVVIDKAGNELRRE